MGVQPTHVPFSSAATEVHMLHPDRLSQSVQFGDAPQRSDSERRNGGGLVLGSAPEQREEEKKVLPGERWPWREGQEGNGDSSGICTSSKRLCKEPGKVLL